MQVLERVTAWQTE